MGDLWHDNHDRQPPRRDWLNIIANILTTIILVAMVWLFVFYNAAKQPEPCWHGRTVPSFEECTNGH
jgi:hypothetical protein